MTDKITLGGQEFPVGRVKFKVLKGLAGLVKKFDLDTEAGNDAYATFITAAVNAVDENFTKSTFDELTVNYDEILAALPIIAPLVGLGSGKSKANEVQSIDR